MGLFEKIKDAQVFETGKYITPGLYSLKLSRLVRGEKRTGRTPYLVVEGKVLSTTSPDFAPGETCCWFIDMTKDAALGNVKGFLSVACDCPIEEVDPAGAEECFSEKSPLVDVTIDAEAYNKPTREGKPFTRVKWLKAGTLNAEKAA